MKKVLVVVLCLLLAAGAAGGGFALYRHLNPVKPNEDAEALPAQNYVVVENNSTINSNMGSLNIISDYDSLGSGVVFLVKSGVTENIGSIIIEPYTFQPDKTNTLKSFECSLRWTSGRVYSGGKRVEDCFKVTRVSEDTTYIKIELLKLPTDLDGVELSYDGVQLNGETEMSFSGSFQIGWLTLSFWK